MSLQIFIRNDLILSLGPIDRIDEEFLLGLQWFFVALEVESVVDDMQFEVGLILEACFA